MTRVLAADFWEVDRCAPGPLADVFTLASIPATWRDRLGGPRQSPERRLAGVLRALKSAISADAIGVSERANFYFEAAHDLLARLCDDAGACDTLSAKCGGLDIRSAAARELLLETHIGFVNAYLKRNGEPSPGDRSLKHAAWAERALKFAGLSADEASAARAWLRNLSIAALERAGRHEESLTAFEQALERSSPASFKDAYVQAVCGTVADGPALDAAAARLRRSFERVSDRPLARQRLTDLYRRQIASLADDAPLGARLLLLQRAVDSDPFSLSAHAMDVQSRFALADAQTQIAQIEKEAAAQGKVLNEKGLVLKNNIMQGFTSVRTYLKSSEAAAIQDAFRRASSHELWNALGLPQTDVWEKDALDLIDAIGAALLHANVDSPAFDQALASEIGARPSLQALDAFAIAPRLLKIKGALDNRAAPADPVLPEILQRSASVAIADTADAHGSEDLGDWLFSRHGAITRWSIVAAAVFVLAAGSLTGYNGYANTRRETLFPQVMAAARNTDYQTVADLSAQFLSRRPLNGGGRLDDTVKQAYAEALVNLFAASPGEPSPALVRAAEKYRQLVGETKEERP